VLHGQNLSEAAYEGITQGVELSHLNDA